MGQGVHLNEFYNSGPADEVSFIVESMLEFPWIRSESILAFFSMGFEINIGFQPFQSCNATAHTEHFRFDASTAGLSPCISRFHGPLGGGDGFVQAFLAPAGKAGKGDACHLQANTRDNQSTAALILRRKYFCR